MDVITIGEMLIDFVAENGENIYASNPGGAVANVAVAVARNGLEAGFIGKIGDDYFGKVLVETLKENNVTYLMDRLTNKANTTLAFASLNHGERSFTFVRRPGADTLLEKKDLNEAEIKKARVLHAGTFSLSASPSREATVYALDLAKKNNVKVSFDINFRDQIWSFEDCKTEFMKVVKYIDWLKISDEELKFVGNIPKFMEDNNIELVIHTKGAKGADCFYKRNFYNVLGIKTKCVDTTGAGDAFFGNFIAEFLRSNDIEKSLVYANKAAAFCVKRKGGIPSMPYHNEIK